MEVPFWRGVLHYESSKVDAWMALRNAAGVVLPLAIGVAAGAATSGLIVASGALNVAFSDGPDPYPQRGRRMLAASFCCALAVLAGGLCGRNHAFTILAAAACAFAAGMMVAVGTTATDIANLTLVILAVYSAQAMEPRHAAASRLAALGGGLLQTALSLALWPLRRSAPGRRALASLYLEIARAASASPRVMEAPPAAAQATQAHAALEGLGREHALEAERYLALLSQAERIRLGILTLVRLRVRIGREEHTGAEAAIVDSALEIAGHTLAAIGESLMERPAIAGRLNELRVLAEALRRHGAAANGADTVRDARPHR